MKKYIILFTTMMLCIMLSAQTQQGYVKTKGRLANDGSVIPGQGLKGATVSIKGRTAVLVNADDGAFSFPVPEAQFRVDSVKKKGYQLVDMDALSKTYKHSANPVYFVMETPTKQMEDQMEDFNRINSSQQAMISQLRAEVKQLKAQNKINEEEYSRRLSEIAEMQSESQKLVCEMAERYSKMDFDQLDEFNRQVSWCIINGDLIKADSLIKSKGSMAERSAELDNLHKANSEVRTDLEKSEQLEAKTLEDFAADCYSLFEICKLKHENDSAAYWLELRASKDTTNCQWLNQLGIFITEYLAQYDKGLSYFNKAIEQTIQEEGELNESVADLYNNIGYVYEELGNYDKSLEYYNKALAIWIALQKDNNPGAATTYNNIGGVYYALAEYDKAFQFLQKALLIRKSVFGENHPKVALSYSNIGVMYKYYNRQDKTKAFEYYNKALTILENNFGENNPNVATCYQNIGVEYYHQDNYEYALKNLQKSLSIRKIILGESHPDVAYSYHNIASVLFDQCEYDKAIEYEIKAVTILESIFEENHPEVATAYTKLGLSLYYTKHDYILALDYLNKALAIRKAVLGENHPKTISTQYSIDCVKYQQAIANNIITEYREDKCFTATIIEGETPASQQGMSGEYILLEYADWNQDSSTSMFDKNDELRGQSKNLLVMKDGIISEHHFENAIGAQFGVKYIGKEEKQRINKAYEEWKKQNRK